MPTGSLRYSSLGFIISTRACLQVPPFCSACRLVPNYIIAFRLGTKRRGLLRIDWKAEFTLLVVLRQQFQRSFELRLSRFTQIGHPSSYILLDPMCAVEQSLGMQVLAVRVFQLRPPLKDLRGLKRIMRNHRCRVSHVVVNAKCIQSRWILRSRRLLDKFDMTPLELLGSFPRT